MIFLVKIIALLLFVIGQEFPVVGKSIFEGNAGEGGIFRDMLVVKDAEVLYSYGDMFYDSFAAVTRKSQGDGTIYYVGCGLDEATLKSIMYTIMRDSSIETEPTVEGVEVCYRGTDENKVRVIMNHTAKELSYGDTVLAPYESKIEKM